LECGKGGRDLDRAAKFYRLSAEKGNAAAQNSFGICLERGTGVRKNLLLAAQYYRRAAQQGHLDGANNFGFCLEHGRGVQQNFELAADYYKFAADRGHPEAKLNRARTLRLLGQWEPPDRSSEAVSHSPLRLPEFIPISEKRLQVSNAIPEAVEVVWVADQTVSGDSSIVEFTVDSDLNPVAVKTAKTPDCAEFVQREKAILEALKHQLVVRMRDCMAFGSASIVTDYEGQGSLANHITTESGLHRPNRIAKVVAGIALAMRFAHSRGLVHRDLKPGNILLSWDWTVRIADFGRSAAPVAPESSSLTGTEWMRARPIGDFRYIAPKCYECTFRQTGDVFAFGMILFEILARAPAFPMDLPGEIVAFSIAIDGARPEIPDFVLPEAQALIRDCWEPDPHDRPTFDEIVDRLEEVEFKVTENVSSIKVADFVKRIEDWEMENLDG
jgi:serine/threonine protein kinase